MIVEYIDTVSPVSRLIPEPNAQRIEVKRWEALADGICDAAQAIVIERGGRPSSRARNGSNASSRRSARPWPNSRANSGSKPWCNGEAYTLADIATGCALGYLELRHPELDWRAEYPNLCAREQAREAAVVPGNRAARRLTGAS